MSKNCEFICVDDFEKYALATLPKYAADYFKSGADEEQTLKENREAYKREKLRMVFKFWYPSQVPVIAREVSEAMSKNLLQKYVRFPDDQRLRFKPRFLRDVSRRCLKTYILGRSISFPVCLAPCAMHRMAHPDGETATVKAAAAEGVAMALSILSTTSLEDVALAAPSSIRWFQLTIYKDRKVSRDLVVRAEKAGYLAIVLTVDAPVFGHRWADTRNKFSLPPHLKLGNFPNIGMDTVAETDGPSSGLNNYVETLFDPSVSWQDIKWLKEITILPILLKGILTAEDAIMAVERGVAGVIVSNHGARQLDGVPATIEVLPEIVRAVAGRCEVYLDGGIRTGTDVLKALALGARAVFIGRPILWGLAHSGEAGVRRVLQILRKEFDTAMALNGCSSLHDVKQSLVVRQESFSKL